MASSSTALMHHALQAVRRYGLQMLKDPNVLAVAVGSKTVRGKPTGDLAVSIFVAHKVARASLPSSAVLPSQLSVSGIDVPTDVVEAGGPFYPFANISTEPPARPGTSIG